MTAKAQEIKRILGLIQCECELPPYAEEKLEEVLELLGELSKQSEADKILINLVDLDNSGLWEECRVNIQLDKARYLLNLW